MNYIQQFMKDNNLQENTTFKIIYLNGDAEKFIIICNKICYNYAYNQEIDDYDNGVPIDVENLNIILSGNYKSLEIIPINNIPKTKFIPKKNEEFYYIGNYGGICYTNNDNFLGNEYIIEHQLVFATREQAEDYKWFLDNVNAYKKPFIRNEHNYSIHYNCADKSIGIGYDISTMFGNLYFGGENNINAFIENAGEERIKKYMFNIWN